MNVPDPYDASVVIACYTEKRWDLLVAAVDSVLAQDLPPREIFVVVDHNPGLQQRVTQQWPQVTVLANRFGQGASGARNTAAFEATSPVVAFLDDDAVAEPTWLSTLLRCLDDLTVVGVGGGVSMAWQGSHPGWFPDEFAWVVGASYTGMPEDTAEVRNVWAENMAVRLARFRAVGGFRLNFGKVGVRSSPEDTDLCIRMARDSGRWLYAPKALVAHHVPLERSTFTFFLRRCFSEGVGKAALAAFSPGEPLQAERDYVRQVLPKAVGRGFRDAVTRRKVDPALRSLAIIAGLGGYAAGYLRERVRPFG
jgi:GT2 family glycosyltransferase